jgi:hypothetical protein
VRTPLIDRVIGKVNGRVLGWLGKRAYDRGDKHEYLHCLAAVRFGNSNHRRYVCELPADIAELPPAPSDVPEQP